MKKAGIICTLGPASCRLSVMREMKAAGMGVARLNFSHGTHAGHAALIRSVRRLGSVKILQDLEGYRIRVGKLPRGPVTLRRGQTVVFSNDLGRLPKNILPFDYDGDLSHIRPGTLFFIDDGRLELVVRSTGKARLAAQVMIGGILGERKGINIPSFHIPFYGLTAKDKRDLEFGLAHGVDFVAQSFVRSKEDVMFLRAAMKAHRKARVIAKIENAEGIRNIDSILEEADGLMVARGDMGVSVPIYKIPVIQKMMIRKCLEKRKFVVTATQMLESMTENHRPTRAEVSDVANAVFDGSDFLMLSGETAAGRYPVEAVRMMKQVIRYTEQAMRRRARHYARRRREDVSHS